MAKDCPLILILAPVFDPTAPSMVTKSPTNLKALHTSPAIDDACSSKLSGDNQTSAFSIMPLLYVERSLHKRNRSVNAKTRTVTDPHSIFPTRRPARWSLFPFPSPHRSP